MRVLVGAGLLVLPVAALAINAEPAGFYTGVGAAQVVARGSGSGTDKPEWTAVEILGGYKQSPYAGLEARLGAGSSPDLLYGGLYYRTESANDTAKTYLLLGYAGASVGDSEDDVSLSGFSYGAGVGFPVGDNFNINLEYRMLLDDSSEDINLSAFSLNLDYRFPGTDLGFKGFSGVDTPMQEPGFYAGLGLAQIDYTVDYRDPEDDEGSEDEDEDSGAPELSWNAIELIGGYSHSPMATLELRLGTTDDGGQGGTELTLNYASIYYRPTANLGTVQLYGLLGYSSVQFKFTDEPDIETGEVESETFTDSGVSFGGGLSLLASQNWQLGLEYRLLMRDKEDGETAELKAVAANISYRF